MLEKQRKPTIVNYSEQRNSDIRDTFLIKNDAIPEVKENDPTKKEDKVVVHNRDLLTDLRP